MSIRVAVGQMTSTNDKLANLLNCQKIIKKAADLGAFMLSLPENFAFLGCVDGDSIQAAESLDGSTILAFKLSAQKYNIWLSLGGFQEIGVDNKIYNSHIIINNLGEIIACYRKIHLFSVNLSDGSSYREDQTVIAGDKIVSFETPFFRGGLTICYDLRFSHLFWALREQGAQLIFCPSAFTDTTGKAHWEILLRARAVETQSYLLAAAQSGLHHNKRRTYGHAMIVDPWGTVIAQCGEDSDLAVAEIDLDYLAKIRKNMPVLQHRRVLT